MAASRTLPKSAASISPFLSRSEDTPEASARIRMASCSALISREKKATTPPDTVFLPSGVGSQR
jgi:hypothetical protein